MNPNSVPSTIVTIQKFLSAFLDRLSKAKISIEAIDPTGKEINDVRQLSTRIMQQWNILFPNSPIHCIDTLSSNTLIATKTREEVILDRTTQQKLKLMMEVEVLRSRLQQQQQESNRLQEEITHHTNYINENKISIQNLQSQKQNLLNMITTLQSQKQQEDTKLQSLQSSKLAILEDLVSLQQATTSQRTSIQALLAEKQEQNKKLDQMKNEQLLLEREIEVILQRQQTIDTSLQQKRETLNHPEDLVENGGNNTDTMTGKTLLSENSINTSITTQADPSPIEANSFDPLYSQWKGYGKRKRNRKYSKPLSSSIKRIEMNPSADIFDDAFWFPLCPNKHSL